MPGFAKGVHAGTQLGRLLHDKKQAGVNQQNKENEAKQKQLQAAFDALKKDFETGIEGIQKARSESATEPDFPKEFTNGLMVPAANRLDQMAQQYGLGAPGHAARLQATMQSPLGSDIAKNKGQLDTIQAQAAVEAGGGVTTTDLPNGQIEQVDNITGETSIKGSPTKRRLITIGGKTGLFSDEEVLSAQNQGIAIGDPEKDVNTKTAFNTATGQFIFATDSQIANDPNMVPPQAGHLASRIEIAAVAVGIDPAIVRSGNLSSLTAEEATKLQQQLQKTDPMAMFMANVLGGSAPSAPSANGPSSTVPTNGGAMSAEQRTRLDELRRKAGK